MTYIYKKRGAKCPFLFCHKDEFSNPVFDELVRKVLQKPFMNENDVKNLADLYWEGLQNGLEDGKYIPFSQWFYEFYEDEIQKLSS